MRLHPRLPVPPEALLLSSREAAALLGILPNGVLTAVAAGTLTPQVLGVRGGRSGGHRFTREEIERYRRHCEAVAVARVAAMRAVGQRSRTPAPSPDASPSPNPSPCIDSSRVIAEACRAYADVGVFHVWRRDVRGMTREYRALPVGEYLPVPEGWRNILRVLKNRARHGWTETDQIGAASYPKAAVK